VRWQLLLGMEAGCRARITTVAVWTAASDMRNMTSSYNLARLSLDARTFASSSKPVLSDTDIRALPAAHSKASVLHELLNLGSKKRSGPLSVLSI
jgi:hypothetical protein